MSSGIRKRSIALAGIGAVVALAAVATVVQQYREPTAESEGRVIPPRPNVDVSGADPAVAAAIREASEQVDEAPQSSRAWGRLGRQLYAHELFGPAMTCFDVAARLDPAEPRWVYLQGVILAQESPLQAVVPLESALALAGDTREVPRVRLAELLLEIDRVAEARNHFRSVLETHSQSMRAILGLARVAYREGELELGLELINRMSAASPGQGAAALLAAQIHLRQGNTELARQARQSVSTATEERWPDPFLDEIEDLRVGLKAVLVRAGTLIDRNQAERALVLLQPLVNEYPDSYTAWLVLGRALIATRRPAEAERALDRALALELESPDAWFQLGIAHYLQGKTKSAGEAFARATVLKADFAMAHYNLGYLLMDRGDDDNATAAFEEAIRHQPGYTDAHARLGVLLARQGRLGEGRRHLEYAVERDPGNRWAKARLRELEKQM